MGAAGPAKAITIEDVALSRKRATGGGESRVPPPILSGKRHHEAPVFTPENLLREARRQLSVPAGAVAPVCVLDPDGDILRYLDRNGRLEAVWAVAARGQYR